MREDGRRRVIIENVRPQVEHGRFPAKRALGEPVEVMADIYADGHDKLAAVCLYRRERDQEWTELPMTLTVNDLWTARFEARHMSPYMFTVRAWVDRFRSWLDGARKKHGAGQDVGVELLGGAEIIDQAASRANSADAESLRGFAESLRKARDQDEGMMLARDPLLLALMDRYPDPELATEYEQELRVQVDPPHAGFSTWYELFPRSAGQGAEHGTFRDVEALLPEIADMGFDVLYLPPIHPIGRTFRKGPNNTVTAGPGDPGSPWAIGSEEGGHKSVHPELGTLEDFRRLVDAVNDQGMELALDIAFQCAPDHPYVKEHPEWFRHRADGTIQYAENPPKKYQDIYPFDFECQEWRALWEELKSVFLFWCEQGVRVFRVDNPHTKPLPFWEWCLGEVKKVYPETIFLSEAFTRPKIMYRLAKVGFTQSYTYFTWRNSKQEITEYVTELVETAPRDYFRPNFWPNTPDILPEYLQYGGRPAFIIRLVLAATLSANYGVYGPAFELCENAAMPASEEYLHSEKYEIKDWDRHQEGSVKAFMARVNAIRRDNPALHSTWNVRFLPADNDFVLFYAKADEGSDDVILTVVNLDPHHPQSAMLHLPLDEFGIEPSQPYMVHDLLGDDKFIWQGGSNMVDLDPQVLPARIFRLKKRLKRETDFDYFM
jgi:starch synthase (maltosyl-transferring)